MLTAMLHAARRRQSEMTEREANGESLWTERFDKRVRVRVRRALDRAWNNQFISLDTIFWLAREKILDEEGLTFLYTDGYAPSADFEMFFLQSADDMFPTAIEALMAMLLDPDSSDDVGALFAPMVNEIFAQERVAWKLVDQQMIEVKSTEMHSAVVEPALRLLHDGRFANVDASYRKALDEIAKGDGADAVTDAGTALQEMLTALGCEGNQLGDLIKSARKKGVLAAHDVPTLDALEKSLHWAAADRTRGSLSTLWAPSS
jgi:hypothetical protein